MKYNLEFRRSAHQPLIRLRLARTESNPARDANLNASISHSFIRIIFGISPAARARARMQKSIGSLRGCIEASGVYKRLGYYTAGL